MPTLERLLFCADVGPAIGLGHLQRCLALAAALEEQGLDAVFAIPDDDDVRKRVSEQGFEMEEAVDGTRFSDLPRLADRINCGIVVIDSYSAEERDMRLLRDSGLRVVAIDDLARFPFSCHLVVNGAANADELPYRSTSGDTHFLLGPTYAMLRKELWEVPLRTPGRPVKNVLVTLGGADPNNLMPELVRTIAALHHEFRLTAIVGPFFESRAALEVLVGDARQSLTVIDAPTSMRTPLLDADLAVSAGGQTVYELARTGVPVVAVQIATNQARGLRALQAMGVVRLAGRAEDPALGQLVAELVGDLVRRAAARNEMSRAGQALVDGAGARRVAAAIAAL